MGNIGLTKDHFNLEGRFGFPYLRKNANYPSDRTESPYDPLEGFPNGRKTRVMVATEAEMDSAKMKSPEHIITRTGQKVMFKNVLKGDYCAHKWIDYKACLKNNRPFYWRCRHERHSYGECQFEDSVLRMKEWEREKRLREREKRSQQQSLDS